MRIGICQSFEDPRGDVTDHSTPHFRISASLIFDFIISCHMHAIEHGSPANKHRLTLPDINMLSPVPKPLPLRPSEYAATPTPSLEDFQQLWKIWDVVSRGMVPHGELYSKPINLRNCCLFYLGHLPTFLDIHVTKAADGKPTEPAWYRKIFERGIDPDVENPELCHAHSEVPAHWPPAEEVFDFQMRVRDRVTGLYEDGKVASNPRVAYALWIGLEHEGENA